MFGLDDHDISSGGSTAPLSRPGGRNDSHLEERFERLSLVCMAMWSLIQDKTKLTEADLMERVHTIDMMDGVADGKATKTVRKCPNCQRTLNPRHKQCLYCGHKELASSAFDNV